MCGRSQLDNPERGNETSSVELSVVFRGSTSGLSKAIVGAVVAGPIGIAAGAINKNKATNSCMACGHQWNPADVQAKRELASPGTPDHTLGYPDSEWLMAGVLGFIVLIGLIIWG